MKTFCQKLIRLFQVAQQVNYAKNLFNEIKQTLPPGGVSSLEALSPT